MADSSKGLQLRELKDMINDLKKMIKTLQATVDAANKREEALTQERDNLKEEVDLLRKKLFGSSSEKRSMDVPGQLNLFNEAELEQNPTIAEPEALESLLPEKETKKRKSRATNAERFKGIPVVKKYLDLPDAEKVCPVCNAPLVKIGEEFVRRELSFVPAKLKVIEIYSLTMTLLLSKREKKAMHICFTVWLRQILSPGSCIRSFVTVFLIPGRKKTGNSTVLLSQEQRWQTG